MLLVVHDVLEEDLLAIEKSNVHYVKQESNPVKIKLRIHKDEYFKKLDLMLAHIFRGDIYEANFLKAGHSPLPGMMNGYGFVERLSKRALLLIGLCHCRFLFL